MEYSSKQLELCKLTSCDSRDIGRFQVTHVEDVYLLCCQRNSRMCSSQIDYVPRLLSVSSSGIF